MNIDKYLYEIIEGYKNSDLEKDKAEILKDFYSCIWSNKNKRRTYTKTIKYKVKNDLLNSKLGQIFNNWSEVDYVGYKAMTDDTDWCSLLRQKINNLYTRYFDEDVILKKDYMDLLKTPYNLYYRWLKGAEINAEDLTKIITDSMQKAEELKSIYQKQKMKKSWEEYKIKIEVFLKRTFDNCKLIEEYENNNLTNKYIYELASEDNFYIKYICDSLEGEMMMWQKEYYEVSRNKGVKYRRCKECGNLIEIKNKKDYSTKYCDKCKKEVIKKQTNKRVKKYRNKKCNAS